MIQCYSNDFHDSGWSMNRYALCAGHWDLFRASFHNRDWDSLRRVKVLLLDFDLVIFESVDELFALKVAPRSHPRWWTAAPPEDMLSMDPHEVHHAHAITRFAFCLRITLYLFSLCRLVNTIFMIISNYIIICHWYCLMRECPWVCRSSPLSQIILKLSS